VTEKAFRVKVANQYGGVRKRHIASRASVAVKLSNHWPTWSTSFVEYLSQTSRNVDM